MLSENDLFRLEQARFARMRELIDLPQQCVQHLDLDCSLSIVAVSQEDAETLLSKRELLQAIAYRVLGTRELNLWHNHKPIWHGETIFSSGSVRDSGLELEATIALEDAPMGTAAIDRETIAQTARTELSETVNAQIDEVIQSEIRALLDEEALQQRVRDRLNLFLGQGSNGSVATVETVASSTKAPPANGKTGRMKKTAKPMALKLPRGFAAQVTNRYKQLLEKLLPTGESRAVYLEAVTNEAPAGKEWLMKIAVAVGKKYKNTDTDRIYQGLLETARKLSQS